MDLPLIPGQDRRFTVVEYPSNAEVKKLARIMARDRRLNEDQREVIADQYNVNTGEMLDGPKADRKAAEIIFEEPIPSGITGEDLSPRAVQEATSVFMGVVTAQSDGQGGI